MRAGHKSIIDYILANKEAQAEILEMTIDDTKKHNVSSDHNWDNTDWAKYRQEMTETLTRYNRSNDQRN